MKKRSFALLLAAAMILGMIVVPAAAVPTETPTAPADTYEADVWYEVGSGTELMNRFSILKSVNFMSINDYEDSQAGRTIGIRLTANVSTQRENGSNSYATFYIGRYNDSDKTDRWPMKVVLDLNGYTITDTSEIHRMFGVYSGSTLVITNGTIIANGCYTSNGNVIFSSGSNKITLDGVHIVSNSTSKASDYSASTRDRVGGGLFRGAGTLTIKNSHLEKCSGYTNNGGILHVTGGTVTLEKSVFKTNTSVEAGGCIYNEGTLTATNCIFMGNTVAAIAQADGSTSPDTNLADDGCGGTIYNIGTMTLNKCIVSGGAAEAEGGNIYNKKTLTLKNTDVESGSAPTWGDNLYIADGATLTMSSGAVDGGVLCLGTANLSGTARITCGDLTGIRFEGNGALKATGLDTDARIVVSGSAAVTESPDLTTYLENKTVIGAARTSLAYEADKLTATAADAEVYCAHCDQTVTWSAFTAATAAGHCYLPEGGLALTEKFTLAADTDLVLDLGAEALELSHSMAVEGDLTVLSTAADEGKILRSTAESGSENGGLISGTAASTVTLCGGTLQGITVSGAIGGGTVYSVGKVYIYGGTVTGGNVTILSDSGVAENYGGNIVIDNTVTGGVGGLYMYGGIIRDGSAYIAGNVYVAGKSGKTGTQFHMYGGLIQNGQSTGKGAGNVQLQQLRSSSYKDAKIQGGIIADGKAATIGGNLYESTGTYLHMTGGALLDGYAATQGGNYYASATSVRFKLDGGWLSGGTADTNGGNLFMNNGYLYFYDGTVAFGTAQNAGGNLYLNAGYYAIADGALAQKYDGGSTIGANASGDMPVIMGGRATTASDSTSYYGMGGNILLTGQLTLSEAVISGGYAAKGYGADLTLCKTGPNNTPKIVIESDFDGELDLACNTGNNTKTLTKFNLTAYGEPIHSMFTAEAPLNATIRYENIADEPLLYANADNALTVSAGKLVDGETGGITWYPTLTEAAAQATGTKYAQAMKDDTLVLTADAQVDLNGKTLTASGSGTLYGFDTANDDYDGYGIVTGVTAAPSFLAPNGNQYVTVDGTSFHRLGQGISNVVLRPGSAGIYYSGSWKCDDILAARIKTQGIALSTAHMPQADFREDSKVLYTQRTADVPDTSVLVQKIIKAGNTENEKRGTTSIFAAAYTVIDDGSEKGLAILSQDGSKLGGVDYDLKTVLQKVDPILPGLEDGQKAAVQKLYELDPTVLSAWSIPNTVGAANGTPSTRELKILTIGNSAAVDDAHMLNLVAAAEGYGAEVQIATLYYSGCSLSKHVTYLQKNSAVYDLYMSDTTSGKPPVIHRDITMLDAIVYTDWDVIIMQGSTATNYKESSYNSGYIEIIQDYVNQHKTDPNAVFAWNMFQANPEDEELQTMYETQTGASAANNAYKKIYEEFDTRADVFAAITGNVGKYIATDSSFTYLIPTGTAVENALTSYLTEKDINRDYTHLTDFSRVIASYTWFCTLTGIDHLEEIQLDTIPKAYLKSTSDKKNDRVLTEAEKAIILEAVNNALADPLQVTQSQYTEAP